MKVIAKRPGEGWKNKVIDGTLADMQSIVGGHIEAVPISEDAAIICNEEGRLLGLPHNTEVFGHDFVGPVCLVGIAGDDFTDAPVSLEVWRALCGED